MTRIRMHVFATAILLLTQTCLGAEKCDPIQFGAKPDGKTLCTAAIQKAIDTCAAAGGGTVEFTKGKYLSGTIFYRSGVTLQLDEGVTLLGSTNVNDYPRTTPDFRTRMDEVEQVTRSLIYAEKVERIALRGKGEINGQGASFQPVLEESMKNGRELLDRPFLIRMIQCKDVSIEDVTLRDSGSWTEDYIACDNLTIRGIRVIAHVIRNNDGIDIDGCQNVHISDVMADVEDDGLCFKGCSLRPTKNVLVENCRFYSNCNSIKYGTDSQGGLENVTIRNVDLGQPAPDMPPAINGWAEGIAGIALEVVDSATMRNVTIDNVKVRGTWAPIYLVLGDRGRHAADKPRLPAGVMQNVTISNVRAEPTKNMGCPIVGIPGHPIEGLTLRNIHITFPGGGKQEDIVRRFTEKAHSYPEAFKYALRLPAFGLFCWHVRGVTLDNVQLTTRQPDERPAIAMEDVADVTLDGKELDLSRLPPRMLVMPQPPELKEPEASRPLWPR